jgi:serine/threonine-protein kinase
MDIQNLSGQILGQYEVQEFLGAGSMGAVYRGTQTSLKRTVAIKILPMSLASEPGYVERFNREAETAAALEHVHIVPIYDFGTQNGLSYVVMRLLTGGTLSERLQHHRAENRLPALKEVSQLLAQLADALDYAHGQGVVHRDVKPNNVLFDVHGNAYLTDFGIAKLLNSASAMTSTGQALGTPAFMAPELWASEQVVPATDQYALGVLTYLILTGRFPFDAPTPYGLIRKHLEETPPRAHMLRGDLPESLADALQRAMAKSPDDRFPTATAFSHAFSEACKIAPSVAAPRVAPVGAAPPTLPLNLSAIPETPIVAAKAARASAKPTPTMKVADPTVLSHRTEPTRTGRRRPLLLALVTLLFAVLCLALIIVLPQPGQETPVQDSTLIEPAVGGTGPTATNTPTPSTTPTKTATARPVTTTIPSPIPTRRRTSTPVPANVATKQPQPTPTPSGGNTAATPVPPPPTATPRPLLDGIVPTLLPGLLN